MDQSSTQTHIVFLGLAQNCEKHLPKFFHVIREISKKKNIKVFIGENGSQDFTFDVIQKNITLNDKINFIDTTFIEEFSDRIKRLALARQKLKSHLLQEKINPKFVCVVDLDDVLNKNFNIELIENLEKILEENKNKYFGISLNSEPYYYDILNFESDEFPNNDVKQLQNNRSIKSYNDRKKYIYNVQKSLTLKRKFDCISGFNGLCLYLYDDFIKSDYLEEKANPTPEHLYLNRKLCKITGKRILVTENMLQMPLEHKPLDNIFFFVMEKLAKYITIYIKNLI
tara:strand:+ start:3477 stop:4328 length:852 start_codon:yes stop_codon:yes gene_type:complete